MPLPAPQLSPLKESWDGDDESEDRPRLRKRSRLMRRLRLHQYIVNGPGLAHLPFDEGHRLKTGLSDKPAEGESLRNHLIRIRNKTQLNKFQDYYPAKTTLKNESDLIRHQLVCVFHDQIRRVVRINYKHYLRLLKPSSNERQPERLIMIQIRSELGMTITDILMKLFEAGVQEPSEHFVSMVAKTLITDDLFKLTRNLFKGELVWMLRGAGYRKWIENVSSSSSDE